MHITCCHKCELRNANCHANCANYIVERIEQNERNRKIRKEKDAELNFNAFKLDMSAKQKKKMNNNSTTISSMRKNRKY